LLFILIVLHNTEEPLQGITYVINGIFLTLKRGIIKAQLICQNAKVVVDFSSMNTTLIAVYKVG